MIDKKCELICKGIKDEEEGQKYYKKLSETLKKEHPIGSWVQEEIKKGYKDEVRHEYMLRGFSIQFNCKCSEKK